MRGKRIAQAIDHGHPPRHARQPSRQRAVDHRLREIRKADLHAQPAQHRRQTQHVEPIAQRIHACAVQRNVHRLGAEGSHDAPLLVVIVRRQREHLDAGPRQFAHQWAAEIANRKGLAGNQRQAPGFGRVADRFFRNGEAGRGSPGYVSPDDVFRSGCQAPSLDCRRPPGPNAWGWRIHGEGAAPTGLSGVGGAPRDECFAGRCGRNDAQAFRTIQCFDDGALPPRPSPARKAGNSLFPWVSFKRPNRANECRDPLRCIGLLGESSGRSRLQADHLADVGNPIRGQTHG